MVMNTLYMYSCTMNTWIKDKGKARAFIADGLKCLKTYQMEEYRIKGEEGKEGSNRGLEKNRLVLELSFRGVLNRAELRQVKY